VTTCVLSHTHGTPVYIRQEVEGVPSTQHFLVTLTAPTTGHNPRPESDHPVCNPNDGSPPVDVTPGDVQQLGSTNVPFGQFYGLAGWRGLRALLRYVTDDKHGPGVPIDAYLIGHFRERLILVDAGICWRQTHEYGEHHTGIQRWLLVAAEYQLDRSEERPAALARLGHRLESPVASERFEASSHSRSPEVCQFLAAGRLGGEF